MSAYRVLNRGVAGPAELTVYARWLRRFQLWNTSLCMRLILSSPISLIHITFALLALLSGTYVLWQPKGTVRHRQVGYVYVGSMLVVLTTAFGIYHLFGRFGIVHWGAVACWLALSMGMGAVWLRTYLRNWLLLHYLGLSGSVAGLYATFIVESTYRLFSPRYFWLTTLGTSMLVFLLAAVLMYRYWDTYLARRHSL